MSASGSEGGSDRGDEINIELLKKVADAKPVGWEGLSREAEALGSSAEEVVMEMRKVIERIQAVLPAWRAAVIQLMGAVQEGVDEAVRNAVESADWESEDE